MVITAHLSSEWIKARGCFMPFIPHPSRAWQLALEDSGKASTCSMTKFGHEPHVNTCMFVNICIYSHWDASPNKVTECTGCHHWKVKASGAQTPPTIHQGGPTTWELCNAITKQHSRWLYYSRSCWISSPCGCPVQRTALLRLYDTLTNCMSS